MLQARGLHDCMLLCYICFAHLLRHSTKVTKMRALHNLYLSVQSQHSQQPFSAHVAYFAVKTDSYI